MRYGRRARVLEGAVILPAIHRHAMSGRGVLLDDAQRTQQSVIRAERPSGATLNSGNH
jgi:hypothetical protein